MAGLIVVLAAGWLVLPFGSPVRGPSRFCGGGGIAGAPVAASPEAAVRAYLGNSAKGWKRMSADETGGQLRFAPKASHCGVIVEGGGDGWRVTEDDGR